MIKALEKLKRQLAEADAELETRKKPPPADAGPRMIGEGLVIDEWVSFDVYMRNYFLVSGGRPSNFDAFCC